MCQWGTLFEVLALKRSLSIFKSQPINNISLIFKHKKIFTTISALELNQTILEEKLQYVTNNNIYKNVSLDFPKQNWSKNTQSVSMKLCFKNYIHLTQAQSKAILDLRNLDYIRLNMQNSTPIAWENHLQWIQTLHDNLHKVFCTYSK